MDKKIRIAVSLSGMARNFEQCCENTLEFFNIDNADVDFFIHSWSNEWYPPRTRSSNKSIQTSIKVDEEELTGKLKDTYSPKKIIVEDQLACEDLLDKICFIKQTLNDKELPSWFYKILDSDKLDPFVSAPLHMAQIYSISRSSKLIDEYSSETGTEYDIVFRFRFDNFMELKDREYRTKMIHDMVKIMRHAEDRSSRATKFQRDYLFAAWITVIGENGFARNCVWIGDKIFACSQEKFRLFSYYFPFHLSRIFGYNIEKPLFWGSCKKINHESPYFMPEHTLYELCMEHDLFVHSHGYLNSLGLVSYRDYHTEVPQDFDSLQRKYTETEKMNHDSVGGIILGL